MAVETIADGVYWFDLGMTNAYLAEADVLTLVDAGMAWHADDVRAGIREAGHALADVERVLITHFDADHVGGLSRLDLDAPVFVGERDADLVAGRRAPPLDGLKGISQRAMGLLTGAIDADVRPVADGDTIGPFEAVHTPGHTRGHTAFVNEALDVAFVGDLVTSDGEAFSPAPWYLSADTDAIRSSVRRLVETAGPVEVVAPGHGRPLTEDGWAALAASVE